ncbi:HPr kinase/phosphatase C-terminal domain-containing protein [Celeribacter marinus]|uniref:HPr kinase/phosphorylase n=1 Tax=Celeribacter marinus TaxID=1397108 RepID=UPI003174D114
MSGLGLTSPKSRPAELCHGSCVALTPSAGLLIVGPSGSGKSTLSLTLMALGATLVCDDQTLLHADDDAEAVIATAPPTIKGQIEARGIGILSATPFDACRVRAIVDLSKVEDERLPPVRNERVIGVSIPLFYKVDGPQFAPALIQWLKGGRIA